ncbi:S41 family peptidase [Aquiflexum gelatinilyticum]|uniref:S41 family peptidase n=1 Tax=Aquiflexum gelatinilyticum TaxID=2961943 RepID=UPI0021673101|nr:S41 family peptidase [Aquiflexum gelatinilyticum]MCS4435349.1 S41 family peptidase [Aquiflexum gelatinilyticum]
MKKNLFLMYFLFGYIGLLFGQTLQPAQMKSDVEIFKKALEAKHPEMYRYTSAEEFESLFDQVKPHLSRDMSVREFYLKMTPIIAALHCGHTKWIVAGQDMYYPFFDADLFPLQLHFENDKAYVISHFDGNEVPVTAEVLSINGEKMGEIIKSLLPKLSFGDGFSQAGKYYQLNHAFPGIFSTHFGTKPTYDVEVLRDGKTKNLTFEGVSHHQIKAYQSSKNKEHEDPFRLEILEANTAWLDIDRFYAYPNEPDFKKFLKATFEQIKENNVSDLVIDLRGNEGGNESYGIELYKYLAESPFSYYDRISVKNKEKLDFETNTSFLFKIASLFNKNGEYGREFTLQKGLKTQKPNKNAFQGNVYLLLDGQSFSVTTEFASRFKSEKRGIIIGTETAGGYAMNTSGFFSIVTLPHSKIDLGIPLLGFHMAGLAENNPKDRGILPDYTIETHAENVQNGVDAVRDFSLELIRKSNATSETVKP